MNDAIIKLKDCDQNFLNEIIEAGGKNANLCFSCGTCSGGCPAGFVMDYTPRQIIRMAALGMRDRVLRSDAIWQCFSCNTCNTRCPRGVEIPKVLAAIKSIAIREGKVGNKKGPAFYTAFTEAAEKDGRVSEASILLRFFLKSKSSFADIARQLLKDAPLGIELVKKGKFPLRAERIKGVEQMQKIYENVRKIGEKE